MRAAIGDSDMGGKIFLLMSETPQFVRMRW